MIIYYTIILFAIISVVVGILDIKEKRAVKAYYRNLRKEMNQ